MMANSAVRRVLAAWGNGDFGRLGHGAECLSEEVPKVVAALLDKNIRTASAGGAHTAAVTDTGILFTAGLNESGQLGHSPIQPYVPVPQPVDLPDPVRSVVAGHHHTLCVTEAGDVYAWGRNQRGQLGIGKAQESLVTQPRLVKALQGMGVIGLATGMEHSLAFTKSGQVFSWGAGERLGHGKPAAFKFWARDELTPRLINALEKHTICGVAAGHMHSGCIDTEGCLYVFGGNRFYQCGLGTDADVAVPTEIPHLPLVGQMAGGGLHTLALRKHGDVHAFGANENGVLGLGEEIRSARTPALVPKLVAAQVATGWKHSAAVNADGKMFTWGWGGSAGSSYSVEGDRRSSGGQLGLGNEFDVWSPTHVEWLQLSDIDWRAQQPTDGTLTWKVLSVSCGFNHTVAVIELCC